MVIDTAKLKISTKTLVAGFTTLWGVMQVPAVNQFVVSLTKVHPHLASTVSLLTAVALALHEPAVQEALGIKRTVDVHEEQVGLKTDGQP